MRVNGPISEHCMNMMGQAIMSQGSDAAFAMHVLHSEYAVSAFLFIILISNLTCDSNKLV
jgi:hypothetical protein